MKLKREINMSAFGFRISLSKEQFTEKEILMALKPHPNSLIIREI